MAEKTIKFPKKIVDHYTNTLKKKIKVDGVLLFGSFAWGVPDKNSDVDLIIISPDFSKISFDERLNFLNHMRDEISCQIPMDVIGYTPKEFGQIERHSAIIARAKQKGKWLLPVKQKSIV